MKISSMLLAASAALALAGCGDDGKSALPTAEAPVEAVAAPNGGDWSQMVTKTAAGGYLMGNPDATVKLIEFGSLTCSHCAEFDAIGVEPLVEKYVKTGRISYEFRNYVRDPLDVTASIIARCGTEAQFFPMTHALFGAQIDWITQAQNVLQVRGQEIQALPPQQQFAAFADAAALKTFAVQRGLPAAKVDACLADPDAASELVNMRNQAGQDFTIPGTPTFVLNGTEVPNAGTFEQLEPFIKAAVGDK